MGKTIPIRLNYSTKLFVSHLLSVFLVSGSIGTFFYSRAMENLVRSLKSRLQNSAALLSESIDARDLANVRGPGDVDSDAYRKTLERIRRVRRTNPDIAFLYVMRLDDEGNIRFVVDSDETEAQALPGRIYDVPLPELITGFKQPTVVSEIYEDEWGSFLSGFAPLRNGEGRYLVGIDMRADEVKNKLRELRLTAMASLFAAVLLALTFALVLSRSYSRRIDVLMRYCRDISLGRLDTRIGEKTHDEFDDLIEAFNSMGDALGVTRRELEQAILDLTASREGLEKRVEERTRELQEVIEKMDVLRGLLPICSSCKKIRDDQGYWKQVELFVSEHTGAKFTHGICPDCMVSLYGDLGEQILNPEAGPPPDDSDAD